MLRNRFLFYFILLSVTAQFSQGLRVEQTKSQKFIEHPQLFLHQHSLSSGKKQKGMVLNALWGHIFLDLLLVAG